MVVVDRSGLMVSASQSFAYLVGHSPRALCDGTRLLLEFFEEVDYISFVELACRLILNPELKSSLISGRLLHGGFPSDKLIYCSLSIVIRRDSRSIPVYVVVTFIPTSSISEVLRKI